MNRVAEKVAHLSPEQKRALAARLLREREANAGVHRLFEAQTERTPEAVAVVFGEGRLTYRELNERANRLAHHLRARGVGPETLVGLCVNRSTEMVVGLLGILKAGGTYVPLDPAFPENRLALMLEDARVGVLVTEQALRDALPAGGAEIVCLDSDWEGIETQSPANPTGGAAATNLAYVLYTSGSTGRPKGVMVPHGALANFLRSMKQNLGFEASDAILAVTTLSFDIAGLELFLPLICGGLVELLGRSEAADGSVIAARLAKGDITFLQATPATWRVLLESRWEGTAGLTMLCGGEALPRALVDRLMDKGKALWNLYGPTETTVWSSAGQVEAGEGSVPIGRAIAETQLYVLDARQRPVPTGVTGELYIGGAGLARGYLHRPGLTAERFLPDPSGKPGSRMYRTGDLARWRADGSLECLGRVDHQVKIRGFRVELGEIEAALARHPAVREAAVTSWPDATGEHSLAAYVAAREGSTADAAELRRFLGDLLPEYMIPSAFVALDALPLTPNGKVDRNALPDPASARGGSSAPYVPPRGPIEEAVAGLWAELLGLDRVGAHDHFFELGGHSLFATQVLARVRDTFAVEPSLRDFLDEPTVAGLSRRIEEGLRVGSGTQVPPIVPVDRGRPIPASFAQARLWFLDQLDPGDSSYNVPAAVRLTGDLDVSALERALNEVVRRHESLRTTFAAEGGIPYQVIAPEVNITLRAEDLEGAESDRVSERLLAEAARPFDLARGPLIRAALFRVGDQEHVAIVTMHHIVSDLWSIGVLIREVAALYDAYRRDQASPLPEPAVQYADFSAWQRDWLAGDALQGQLNYWKGRLAGVPPLELPTDRPRAAAGRRRGSERILAMPGEVLAGLQKLGREEGTTPFMTLLAAFQVLLHRYSGADDFAVGSPIAGRTRSETEGLVGFFVNTLVFRADLAGDPTFRDLLRRTRKEALGAYAHQDLPLDQVVNAIQGGRSSGRSLFQAMLALQNGPMPPLESPGLVMEEVKVAVGSAKFDLTLFVQEADGGLLATMEYDADLFDASTVDRMLRHFQTLLEGIVADSDRPVGALPMLDEEEQRRMLGHSDTDAAIDDDSGLDDLSEDELDAMLRDLTPGAEDDPTHE